MRRGQELNRNNRIDSELVATVATRSSTMVDPPHSLLNIPAPAIRLDATGVFFGRCDHRHIVGRRGAIGYVASLGLALPLKAGLVWL